MRTRIVMAWGASVLAALLVGASLGAPGTRAAFSDSVTVTQEIRTGRVTVVLTAVDGTALANPSDSHHLTDALSSQTVDLRHALTLRNDGTLDIGFLSLTTSPSNVDIAPAMAKLVLEAAYTGRDGKEMTQSHPLSYWLAEPRTFATGLGLAPGDALDVGLHLTGTLPTEEQGAVELTYQFTARAG